MVKKRSLGLYFKKYSKLIENGNTTHQHLWDTGKAIPRGKFIALKMHTLEKEDLKSIIKAPHRDFRK